MAGSTMPDQRADFATVKALFERIMLCIICSTMFEDTILLC